MATTILDKLSPSAEIGASLGGGLSSGLQSLITAKLGQMQKQAGMTGVMPGQQAQALSYLPDDILKTLLPQIQKNQQFQQGLRQFDTQPTPVDPTAVDPTQQTQPGQLEQLIQPDQQPMGFSDQDVVNRVATQDQQRKVDENARINKAGKDAWIASRGDNKEVLKAQSQERKVIQKENTEDRKEKRADMLELRKENNTISKDIISDYKTSKTEIRDLDRLDEIVSAKNLTRPRLASMYKLFSKVGLNLDSLMTPDSQEFEKISTGFLKNIKNYFPGGRVSVIEVESFLKTIPTLTQSREGKRKVIHNMRVVNEAKELRYNANNDIKAKYGKDLPDNLDFMIEERIGPKLDALAEKFRSGMPVKQRKTKPSILSGAQVYSPSKIITGALNTLLGKG